MVTINALFEHGVVAQTEVETGEFEKNKKKMDAESGEEVGEFGDVALGHLQRLVLGQLWRGEKKKKTRHMKTSSEQLAQSSRNGPGFF